MQHGHQHNLLLRWAPCALAIIRTWVQVFQQTLPVLQELMSCTPGVVTCWQFPKIPINGTTNLIHQWQALWAASARCLLRVSPCLFGRSVFNISIPEPREAASGPLALDAHGCTQQACTRLALYLGARSEPTHRAETRNLSHELLAALLRTSLHRVRSAAAEKA